ncbi:MAG TPA: hypothetical protein VLE02_01980 [Nitrosarchaeum sp.]|nr:hypothetical protein [Nitrosarchaeum sp.]
MAISSPILISLAAAVCLLFVIMILTAMASTASKKGDDETADKYATWSSVLVGLATLAAVCALGLYVYINKFNCTYLSRA